MMLRFKSFVSHCALVSVAVSCGQSLVAADWPQWRGPNRDGVWTETGLVETFDSPTAQRVWSAPVGAGYSGPTVSDGKVYLTSRVEEPEQMEQIHCFDEATGAEIWTFQYPCEYFDIGYPLGPRGAVAISDGKAYALGAMGHFHALDAKTGEVLWKKDFVADYNTSMPTWGITSSPLVDDERVYLQVGGQPDAIIVAFDKNSGKEVWRALDGGASYSAPRFFEQAGKRLVLVWTGNWFAALDPATGEAAWKHPFKKAKGVINVPDAVIDYEGNRIFLTSFYDGSYLYEFNPDKLESTLLWKRKGINERKTDALHTMIMTSVIRGNYVYGLDSYGEMRCLDLANGDRVWEDQTLIDKGRWGTIFFVQNGEHTWMFTENGDLVIGKLSPQGFEEISRTHIIDPTTFLPNRSGNILWSHPAYANKRIYARNDQELVCVDLSK